MIAYAASSMFEDVISALSLGSMYSLYALGIALVFGVMRMINFAHGELITTGAFALALITGVPFFPLIGLMLVIVVGLALLTERVAFRPVRSANASTLLVTSFAVSFFLQSLMVLTVGSRVRTRSIGISLTGSFTVRGVNIGYLQVTTIGLTIVLLVGLQLFLSRTMLGIQMRAAAEDFTMARLLGVRADSVIATAFGLSGMLATAAAFLLFVATASVFPTVGVSPVLIAFIATVVGGVGSLPGAVIGGSLMGVLTVVFQITLPLALRPYRGAMVFLVVLVVLVLRPNGIVNVAASEREV